MCNIAGYVGDRPAAPILIEMLRRQEGLDCGYYTGMATIHEGKIYYAKLTGNLDDFLAKTDAASFPGTIGIIHGRTPGAPEELDPWAHPFVCEKDGEVKTALVMNGTIGYFRTMTDIQVEVAKNLIEKGYEITSRIPSETNGLNMGDGTRVHYSDVLCQLVSSHVLEGDDTVSAAAKGFLEIPGECVALILSLTEPDAITYVRRNFPMHVGFAEHGTYLATSPQAFPEDAGEPTLLPILSSGLIKKDGFTVTAFPEGPGSIPPLDFRVNSEAYSRICEALKEDWKAFPQLAWKANEVFDPADVSCSQMMAVSYEILAELYRKGKIETIIEELPGMKEGLKAPKKMMRYQE